MPNRIKGITIEINGDATGLDKALKGVNSTLKEANNGLRDVNKLLKLDPSNVDLLKQKQGYLNDAISASKEKLETERQALEQLKNSDGFDENSEQAKALERQIIADEQALQDLQKQAKEFGSVGAQQIKQVGEQFKQVGEKITNVGKTMSTRVTAPIVAVGAASMAAWKEVDAGMDIVVAKTGATGDALKDLQGAVEDVATSIPTDFETAGNAVGELNTRFGVTGDELRDLSSVYVKFAQINGTDVVSAIDESQKALTAFGLGAEHAEELLDTLNYTGQATGISMETLLSGLVQNGTAFQEMGLSIDQAATFMGQMEVSGADASAVMGGLSKALKNATADGKPLNQALEELQASIVNGTGATDGLTAAYELFGKSGAQVYSAVKSGSLDFTNLALSADTANGSVTAAFEGMKDPADDFTVAMNQAQVAGAELGTQIQIAAAPAITELTKLIGTVTEKFRQLTPEQQQTIVKIGAVVAAIGPALVIGGKLISSIGSIISLIGTVVGVLGGPLTIAIGAAVAAGVLIYKNWDTIKEKGTQLLASVKSTFENIKATITNAVNKIKGVFNFSWHLPQIRLPHFSIMGNFSLNPLSVPSFGVNWYRKAYDDGVLFNRPTVLPTAGGLKGFGDGVGSEVVLGLSRLRELVGSSGGTTTINVYGAPGQSEEALAEIIMDKITTIQQQEAIGTL